MINILINEIFNEKNSFNNNIFHISFRENNIQLIIKEIIKCYKSFVKEKHKIIEFPNFEKRQINPKINPIFIIKRNK